MDKILIHGGHRLNGIVRISGSKNSALPILAATLLTKDACTISNVPDLSDIHYMLQILTGLGAQVERFSGTVRVAAENIRSEAPYDIVRKMRASVCVLGPLLGRNKEAVVSLPGGCVIGDRPIDLHLKGFEALGAVSRIEHGNVKIFASHLQGTTINLRGKKKQIRVYELLGLPGQISAKKLAGYRMYEHGLNAYRERRWDEAEAALKSAVAALGDDQPSNILLGLISGLKCNPPSGDWDGTLHLGAS